MFFGSSAFFSLPAVGLFSCSRLRGTQGTRRNTRAQVRALADVRGTYWGFKVASPHGEAFRARRAIQATENYVHVKRMSAGSCDIWDLSLIHI